MIFAVSCNEVGEQEIYLIPQGFQGAVFVIFNQKGGTPAKYDDHKRIYEVPDDGVLRTQFHPNKGSRRLPTVYYVANDHRVIVPFEVSVRDVEDGATQACCLGGGLLFKDGGGTRPTPYSYFYIGTEPKIDSAFVIRPKVNMSRYLED